MQNISELKKFLKSAKLATYASQSVQSSVTPLLPCSKQLEFSNNNFLYRDIYFGMFNFVGQETVYYFDESIWGMSYSGGLSSDIPQHYVGKVYEFLCKALSSISPEMPIRGPEQLKEGGMVYTCKVSGSIESFHGVETITESELCLYQLNFSGGSIK